MTIAEERLKWFQQQVDECGSLEAFEQDQKNNNPNFHQSQLNALPTREELASMKSAQKK